jgi:hypothetical protein
MKELVNALGIRMRYRRWGSALAEQDWHRFTKASPSGCDLSCDSKALPPQRLGVFCLNSAFDKLQEVAVAKPSNTTNR